jgi:hypothetical protein
LSQQSLQRPSRQPILPQWMTPRNWGILSALSVSPSPSFPCSNFVTPLA